MEKNLIALNSTLNFAELIAIVAGGFYLDRRIRKIENSTTLDFPKIHAGDTEKNDYIIKLEKSIATLSKRLDTHEDIISKILLNANSIKYDLNDIPKEEFNEKPTVRLNVSPGRSGPVFRGRSRLISSTNINDKNSSKESEPDVSESEFKIDLEKYNELD